MVIIFTDNDRLMEYLDLLMQSLGPATSKTLCINDYATPWKITYLLIDYLVSINITVNTAMETVQ